MSRPPARLGCLLVLFLLAGCEPRSQTAPPAAPPTLQGFSGLAPLPLPKVSLGVLGPKRPLSAVYRGAYDFSADWFTWNLPVWEKALAPYKGRPGLRYLEVGVFEGRSLLWMLENVLTDPGARATVIDPLDGDVRSRLLANLRKSGAERKVTVIVGYSQVELRRLSLDGYDIAYIDGSHSADDVLEDALLTWRLLKPGGLLIFDDYAWRPGSPHAKDWPGPGLEAFYTFYGHNFEVVHVDYQLILRRRSPDGTPPRVDSHRSPERRPVAQRGCVLRPAAPPRSGPAPLGPGAALPRPRRDVGRTEAARDVHPSRGEGTRIRVSPTSR